MMIKEEDERGANLAQNYVCTEDNALSAYKGFGPLDLLTLRLKGVISDIRNIKNESKLDVETSKKLYLVAIAIDRLLTYVDDGGAAP